MKDRSVAVKPPTDADIIRAIVRRAPWAKLAVVRWTHAGEPWIGVVTTWQTEEVDGETWGLLAAGRNEGELINRVNTCEL